jgi:hypothetical protein
MSINYDDLAEKTDNLVTNIHKLKENISVLKKKIIMISCINNKLEKNKILKQETNSNLLFQSSILKNEYIYYTNIYDIIIDKYSKELYELSEYILIILVSLNNLEIDNNDAKKLIYNKIIYTKKNNTMNSGKLKEIINNITNNLKVVDEFIKLFDIYIEKLSVENKNKNIHNSNFEINIKYKKQIIIVEYTKYCDKFIKNIDYFKLCSDSIINQIETSELLKFFLKLKT